MRVYLEIAGDRAAENVEEDRSSSGEDRPRGDILTESLSLRILEEENT